MNNNEADYIKFTQHSSINTYYKNNKFNTKFIIVYLLFFTTLALGMYLGFLYCQDQKQSAYQTKIMGASDVYHANNEALEYKYQIAFNEESEPMEDHPTLEEDSLYTEVLAQEFDKRLVNQERIIEVQKGDSIESLAKEFYGDVKAVDKIVESNSDITDASQMIYVGQKIRLPY